jgi:hypothetical protein
MGWDRFEKREPCQCGKGTVPYVSYESDFMQEREDTPVMECDECRDASEYRAVFDGRTKPNASRLLKKASAGAPGRVPRS